jgi:Flp pilus assembly protein TadB
MNGGEWDYITWSDQRARKQIALSCLGWLPFCAASIVLAIVVSPWLAVPTTVAGVAVAVTLPTLASRAHRKRLEARGLLPGGEPDGEA